MHPGLFARERELRSRFKRNAVFILFLASIVESIGEWDELTKRVLCMKFFRHNRELNVVVEKMIYMYRGKK